MNTAIRVVTYILVLVFGIALGFYLGARFYDTTMLGTEMLETNYYGAHMEVQLEHGTDSSREDAVRTLIALNEKRIARPSRYLTERMLAIDLALSYARLAALARKRGATQEAEQYSSKAVSFCPKIGWQVCSIEEINQMVQQLDKRGIFGTKRPE